MCKGISVFGSPLVLVFIERRTASFSMAFSFDQHSMFELVSGNGPSTGRVSITLIGVNFGKVGSSVTARLGPYLSFGPTSFVMSLWTSDSSVRLQMQAGAGRDLNVTVSMNTRDTTAVMFSYDVPVVIDISIRSCSTIGHCKPVQPPSAVRRLRSNPLWTMSTYLQ